MPPHAQIDESSNGRLLVPVQRTAQSDKFEFEAIYTHHYRDVARYVLTLTRSSEEADEVISETFERALRVWGTPPERPLPWLLLTGRRIATDRWRRARRVARISLGRVERSTAGAEEERTEFWLWFDKLAEVVSDRQREALVLRYQRDLTDSEIGSILGLSESGVRSLVARALALLRSHPELRP